MEKSTESYEMNFPNALLSNYLALRFMSRTSVIIFFTQDALSFLTLLDITPLTTLRF